MFVKFCPDPTLANVFRCKPIQEWSAKEIQSRTHDYQREFGSRGTSLKNLRSHKTLVLNSENVDSEHPGMAQTTVQLQLVLQLVRFFLTFCSDVYPARAYINTLSSTGSAMPSPLPLTSIKDNSTHTTVAHSYDGDDGTAHRQSSVL